MIAITCIGDAMVSNLTKKTMSYDLRHLEEPALFESSAAVEVIVAVVMAVKVLETAPVAAAAAVVVAVSFSFEILVVFL